MALPMNVTPVYTLTIPSTKKEFKYRPFLVKEEKALLIAQTSEDVTVMLDTVKDVIKSCAKTDLDIDKLASFDIEYIFVNLRAVSVGEVVELMFKCDTCTSEEAVAKTLIDLRECKVTFQDGHTNKIPLFDNVGVVMKYPTLETLQALDSSNEREIDQIFDIVISCIDYIYSAEEVFAAKDQKREDMLQFINNLTGAHFEKIRTFFRTMPQLRVDVKYTCPVCKKDHNKYMEGLKSFF